jgi:lipoprotein NlpI
VTFRRLFLGQATPEEVLAAADDPNAKTKQGKVCEANFYTAELALQRRAKDEATRLLRLAATECGKGFIERAAANAELKALGIPEYVAGTSSAKSDNRHDGAGKPRREPAVLKILAGT